MENLQLRKYKCLHVKWQHCHFRSIQSKALKVQQRKSGKLVTLRHVMKFHIIMNALELPNKIYFEFCSLEI